PEVEAGGRRRLRAQPRGHGACLTRGTMAAPNPLAMNGAGRERELGLLERELAEARSRRVARWAFVRGPGGIGKTYLLESLARRIEGSGGNAVPLRLGPEPLSILAAAPRLLALAGSSGVPAR